MGGAEMAFVTHYGRFRAFGALSWPAREDQFAMGRATGWTVIKSLEVGSMPGRDTVKP